MAAITFDTLKFATRLEKAGIPREHAQAEAEALADVFEAGAQELATKADLKLLAAELRTEMRDIRTDIIKWVVGLALGQIALLVGILLKMP